MEALGEDGEDDRTNYRHSHDFGSQQCEDYEEGTAAEEIDRTNLGNYRNEEEAEENEDQQCME